MRTAIIAPALALAACATPAQHASDSLNHGLDGLVGQPVEVAIARLGEPSASAQTGTDRVYSWTRAFAGTELLNPTTDFVYPADFRGGVFPPPRRTVQNECTICMAVGADGLIRDWDYRGNDRSCRSYANLLAGNALARLD